MWQAAAKRLPKDFQMWCKILWPKNQTESTSNIIPTPVFHSDGNITICNFHFNQEWETSYYGRKQTQIPEWYYTVGWSESYNWKRQRSHCISPGQRQDWPVGAHLNLAMTFILRNLITSSQCLALVLTNMHTNASEWSDLPALDANKHHLVVQTPDERLFLMAKWKQSSNTIYTYNMNWIEKAAAGNHKT